MKEGFFKGSNEAAENDLFAKDMFCYGVFSMVCHWAVFRQMEINGVTLEPGQAVISVNGWAKRLGVSRKFLRGKLEALKAANLIRIEGPNHGAKFGAKFRANKNSVVTICYLNNYYKTDIQQKATFGAKCGAKPSGQHIEDSIYIEDRIKEDSLSTAANAATPRPAENLNKNSFVKWWNETKRQTKSQIPAINTKTELSEKRAKALRLLIAEYSKRDLIKVFSFCFRSDFYNGRTNGSGHLNWVADIDFLCKPSNFVKALERMENESGNGNNEGGTAPATPPDDNSKTKGGNVSALDDLKNFDKYFN